MSIDRQPVQSSNLKSIGYDPQTKTMHVEFDGGRLYEYSGVGQIEHAALVKADSVGRHFHKHFRHNERYPAKRLDRAA